jgi:hypothetical protein
MDPSKLPRSRYLRVARRAYLAQLAAVGALSVVPLACGGQDDSAVFAAGSASSTTAHDTASHATTTLAQAAASTATTARAAGGTGVATTAVATTAKASTIPAGAELAVSFTYTPASSPARNPYIAVWVEDASGKLVRTISLWYEQGGKGSRWLNDLRSWASASGSRPDATTSGATRSAGSYSVVWDGTDLTGARVAAGTYTLFVESAREHGPHAITSAAVTLGAGATAVALPDQGELTALSAKLVVR